MSDSFKLPSFDDTAREQDTIMGIESFRQHNLKYLMVLQEDLANQPEGIRKIVAQFMVGILSSWEAIVKIGEEIKRGI